MGAQRGLMPLLTHMPDEVGGGNAAAVCAHGGADNGGSRNAGIKAIEVDKAHRGRRLLRARAARVGATAGQAFVCGEGEGGYAWVSHSTNHWVGT